MQVKIALEEHVESPHFPATGSHDFIDHNHFANVQKRLREYMLRTEDTYTRKQQSSMDSKENRSALTRNLLPRRVAVLTFLIASTALAQTGPELRPAPGSQPLDIDRVLGLVPFVDAPSLSDSNVAPLSNQQKFQFFLRTAVDPGTAVVGVIGAGIDAKSTFQPAYGGGAAAFGQKTGAIAAGYASNTLISRSLLPMMFHQDPRYFRKEHGSVGSRILYATSRVFVTQTDSGHSAFNTSFLAGTALSTALSNAYYPERSRNAAGSASRYGETIGINMVVNVVLEFWKPRRR